MPNTKYRYSYSGTDVQNIAWYSLYAGGSIYNSAPVNMESLTTISINIHEGKSPVRSLGYRSPKGFTSSVRTIAGTMIFSIVNNHPLFGLIEEYKRFFQKHGYYNYSLDRDRDGSGFVPHYLSGNQNSSIMPTYLPPFNMLLVMNSETDYDQFSLYRNIEPLEGTYGIIRKDTGNTSAPGARLGLFGIEIIDSTTIFSTNNSLSEITATFVAQDVAEFNNMTLLLDLAKFDKELKFASADPFEKGSEKDELKAEVTSVDSSSPKYAGVNRASQLLPPEEF